MIPVDPLLVVKGIREQHVIGIDPPSKEPVETILLGSKGGLAHQHYLFLRRADRNCPEGLAVRRNSDTAIESLEGGKDVRVGGIDRYIIHLGRYIVLYCGIVGEKDLWQFVKE